MFFKQTGTLLAQTLGLKQKDGKDVGEFPKEYAFMHRQEMAQMLSQAVIANIDFRRLKTGRRLCYQAQKSVLSKLHKDNLEGPLPQRFWRADFL